MLWIGYGFDHLVSLLLGKLSISIVAAFFGPVFDESPVEAKLVIGSFGIFENLSEAGDVKEFFEIMAVDLPSPFWTDRKFVMASQLGDASLQSAFHGVSRQIICGVESACFEERPRVGDASFSEFLEIVSVHSGSSESIQYSVRKSW